MELDKHSLHTIHMALLYFSEKDLHNANRVSTGPEITFAQVGTLKEEFRAMEVKGQSCIITEKSSL